MASEMEKVARIKADAVERAAKVKAEAMDRQTKAMDRQAHTYWLQGIGAVLSSGALLYVGHRFHGVRIVIPRHKIR